MDTNKKTDRNENGLIRMSAPTRDYMTFDKDFVEIWPQNTDTDKRINCAVYLKIFKAFSSDIKKLRLNKITENELKRMKLESDLEEVKNARIKDEEINKEIIDALKDEIHLLNKKKNFEGS